MQTPLCIAHTLATFTLVVGLTACDENVPTETRAPSRTTPVSVELDEANSTQQSDVSTSSIALPVNQSVSTVAPNPAFKINQIGTGPNGIFQITRATSTQTALQALTNGRGRAGFFQITNSANLLPALQGQTNGSGSGVQGIASGANGGGGSFQITNATNPGYAVFASTIGAGSAGRFEISNVNNGHPALWVQSNGSGVGVTVLQTGTGPGGAFSLGNANNFRNALEANTNGSGAAVLGGTTGTGLAGSFVNLNANNTNSTLSTSTIGLGPAFSAYQNGLGPGERVIISNVSSSASALGVLTTGTGLALDVIGPSRFYGNVTVQGTLTKSAGSFRIDDPIDPEHKYLSHSFVESPDMKNVYDGTVTLDANGRATVELPDYFEALNRDFRYQLTAIGAPGPNLYIAQGVTQNHFRIAGGRAYAHVSWQVTGVRHDRYAEEHRIKVEEEKPLQEQKQPVAGHLIARR